MLCKYSNIFGSPNTGIHSIRIYDIAIIDVILTLLLALLVSYYLKINIIITFFILIIIGELLHLLFCVKTTFVKFFINILNNIYHF